MTAVDTLRLVSNILMTKFGFVGANMIEQKRLGDIATYINGFAFKPADRSTVGLPIIRIQNLTGNAYDLGFYDGSYPKQIEINDGDVLISWSASLGVYVWNRGKALLNQHIFKVAFDKCDVNREFFVYAVRHKLKEMESKTHGATMKHIVKKDFDNTLIPFPALNEQRKIAGLLNTAATIISARQSQLQKLDELVKFRFVELFGDPVYNSMGLKTIPLGKACCLKAGITTPADMIHEQSNEFSVPCYGGNGIRGYVESATQCGCYPIIGRQGALCGNVQLATGRFHATEHAVLVTPLIETNVVWLFYLLKMMDLYRFHTGAAQPGLAVKTLNTVDIPIADVTVQHQFATFVEQVDKSKVVAQKALDKAKLLFNSLMQKYFG